MPLWLIGGASGLAWVDVDGEGLRERENGKGGRRRETQLPSGCALSQPCIMGDQRKMSLFNRWKAQTSESGLDGISEEELVEYKEAFRLFDKVFFHN